MVYEIKDLFKTYGKKPVLNVKDIKIKEGEIVGLVGSNGSGKSTLLRHMAFLEEPTSGVIKYRNECSKDIKLEKKREISILLPEPYLLKRTVKENLLFGLKIRKNLTDIEKKIDEVLNLVGLIPKKFKNRPWHELSSGETQRVAFAARLILKPRTLLLDEPTNSLDISGVPVFTEAMLYANQNWGTTIVVASHDLDWLSLITTRNLGLHFGRVMEFSTTNLIVGDWLEEGEFVKFNFSKDQTLKLPSSWKVGKKRGVAINPRKIELKPLQEAIDENLFFLEGRINEILHLIKSDELSIKIMVGDKILEAIVPFKEFQKSPFFPSQRVNMVFSQDSIKIPR